MFKGERIKNQDAIWGVFLLGLITSTSGEKQYLLSWTYVGAIKIHEKYSLLYALDCDLTSKCLFCLRFSSASLLLPSPLCQSCLWWWTASRTKPCPRHTTHGQVGGSSRDTEGPGLAHREHKD